MRVHVYSEELTHDIRVVSRYATNSSLFYGLRVYLKSPPDLHHDENDDDRSAVTFWFASMAELNDFREALYTRSREVR